MSTFTPPEDFPHPHVSFRGEVGPDWLDANEHMNVSWYDRVFDEAEMRFFVEFGIEENSIRETGLTFFRLEKLVGYERENMSGDAIEVRSRVIWTDFRRVHHFHEMWNLTRQYRAAHVDAVSIHVDLRTRKSVEMTSPQARAVIARCVAAHAGEPPVAGILHRIEGRRPVR
ncbi:MAG: thioesterase family protein [Nitratireductor sp.]|nr:thioesterase family protein [Nitratireductor sp.]